MGTYIHHAIIVTSFDQELLQDLHRKAQALELVITPIARVANGYGSFMVCPDGLSAGSERNVLLRNAREKLKALIPRSSVNWIEVRYGTDSERASIEDGSEPRRDTLSYFGKER